MTGHSGCPFKPKEDAMAIKAVLSLAVVFAVLLVAGNAVRGPQQVNASSSSKASKVVDVNKLESTIDLRALPRQKVSYAECLAPLAIRTAP
jgi:hypothetical protein